MPANGKWDLIRRLSDIWMRLFSYLPRLISEKNTMLNGYFFEVDIAARTWCLPLTSTGYLKSEWHFTCAHPVCFLGSKISNYILITSSHSSVLISIMQFHFPQSFCNNLRSSSYLNCFSIHDKVSICVRRINVYVTALFIFSFPRITFRRFRKIAKNDY